MQTPPSAISSRAPASLAWRGLVWTLVGCAALWPWAALAGPDGGDVVAGEADIHYGGGDTRIDVHTDDAIIEWGDFDIDAGERVEFVQPGEWSRVLNRVLDPEMTRIDGELTANGQIYIVNPAGVYFGGNAIVETARLVAAAGHIGNDDFLEGRDDFQLTGLLENQGLLRAYDVTLLGASVINGGDVEVDDGALLLVAGDRVWLAEHGSPVLIQVQGPESLAADRLGVRNEGTLDAGHGRVSLVAGDHLGLAIQQRGLVRGGDIEIAGGSGGHLAVAGRVDAASSRGEGGEIRIAGERITLSNALLDASGAFGGGRIRVGSGDGERASRVVRIDEGSTVRADAFFDGDGGEIVVDSAGWTLVDGQLSARGGLAAGSAGFIETSGDFVRVSRAPVLGGGGEWLIDPVDIRIESSPAMPDPLPDTDEPTTGSLFAAEMIAAVLSAGDDVTLSTEQAGAEQGDITLAGLIQTDSAAEGVTANLTLLAADDLTVEATGGIANQPGSELTLNVRLVADDPDQPKADPATVTGLLTLDGAIDVSGGSGGNVVLEGRDLDVNAPVTTDGGGGIALQATGGSVDIAGDLDSAAGLLAVRAIGDETAGSGGIRLDGGATLRTRSSVSEEGETIRGGRIELVAIGGDLELAAGAEAITSEGGRLEAIVADSGESQGNLIADRVIDTSLTGEDGGDIVLVAPVVDSLQPLTSGGGDITLIGATAVRSQAGIDSSGPDTGGILRLASNGDEFLTQLADGTQLSILEDEQVDREVAITAGSLQSGGGLIQLDARNGVRRDGEVVSSQVVIAPGATLSSDGGAIAINADPAASGSDVVIGGDLASGTGTVAITSSAVFAPTRADDAAEFVGGRIVLDGSITTEGSDFVAAVGNEPAQAAQVGGAVELRAVDGDIDINGSISTEGGAVRLDSSRSYLAYEDTGTVDPDTQEPVFQAVTSTDLNDFDAGLSPVRGGGRVTVAGAGSIDSSTGALVTDPDAPLSGGSLTVDADELATLGGISTGGGSLRVGFEALDRVPVDNTGPAFAIGDVATAGGDIELRGQSGTIDGDLDLVGPPPAMGDPDRGSLTAVVSDGLRVGDAADVRIAAESLSLAAGSDGTGDLALGNTQAGNDFGVVLDFTDTASLEAGDGFTADDVAAPEQTQARVDFQKLETSPTGTGAGPLTFAVRQDADLDTTDIPEGPNLEFAGIQVSLTASDGRVTVDPAQVAGASLLRLRAEGQESADAVATPGSEPFVVGGDLAVDAIELETERHFVLDTTLADRLGAGTPARFAVTTGLGSDAAGTPVGGDLALDSGTTVRAEVVALHAGAAGGGDLRLGDATLAGDEIELRAGAEGVTASIDVGTARFEALADANASPGRLAFVQEAAVVDALLPELASFGAGDVADMAYTIQSQSALSIGVDDATASKVDGSDLELITGSGLIELLRSIQVDSLALRGLAGLTIEADTAANIGFTPDTGNGARSLELQSGSVAGGNLGFGSGVELAGDSIRLWAGNGVALQGNTSSGESRIELPADLRFVNADRDGAPDTFVFQQEDRIVSADLPGAAQFGPSGSPGSPSLYAIRSDDRGLGQPAVELTALPEVASPGGGLPGTLIVAGSSVTIGNTDGEDFDFRQGDPTDGGERALELRADDLVFRATLVETSETPEDTDGFASLLGLRALSDNDRLSLGRFEADDVLAEPDFVFEGQRDALEIGATPTLRPETFSFTQDADIDSADLPTLATAFQAADPEGAMAYTIQSDQGEIFFSDAAHYADVEGSDLVLDVRSLAQDGLGADDDIDFAPGTLSVRSLIARTRGAFFVEPVTIDASEDLQLRSAALPVTGAFEPEPSGQLGDLSFADDGGGGPGVTLRGSTIELVAGDGAAAPGSDGQTLDLVVRDADGNLLPGAVVDAANLRIEFSSPAEGGPTLAIVQDGDVDPSQLPDSANLVLDPATRLELYAISQLEPERTIEIDDLAGFLRKAGGAPLADRVTLFGERVALGTTGVAGDLDLGELETLGTDLTIGASEMTFLAGAGSEVIFSAPGTADQEPRLVLTNAEALTSEALIERIRVEQGAPLRAGNVPLTAQREDAPAIFELASGGDIVLDDPDTDDSEESIVDRLRLASVLLESSAGVSIESDIELLDAIEDLFVAAPLRVAAGVERVESLGDILVAGDLTVESDELRFSADSLAFYGSVQGDGGDDERLVVDALENVSFLDDVSALLDFEVHFGRNRVDDRLPTLEFGGLGGIAAEIAAGSFDLGSAFDAPAVPDGGRDVAVTVAGSVVLDSAPAAFDDDGQVSFPDGARSTIPDVATIVQRNGNLSFASTGGGDLTIGGGEKLTVLGDPDPDAGTSTGDLTITGFSQVTLSDVTALGTLRVVADAVSVNLRRGGPVLQPDGDRRSDSAVDWVASEMVLQTPGGAPIQSVGFLGTGRRLVAGLANPFAAPPFLDALPLFQTTLARADLLRGGVVLDKLPDGSSVRDLSEAILDDLPRPSVPVPSDPRPPEPESLARVGIEARELTREERQGRLAGAAIYDDREAADGAGRVTVAVARLQPEAGRAEELFLRIFGADMSGAAHVREVLGEAVATYREETGARRVIGFELRRYLRNRPSSMFEAYRMLEQLDALFEAHRSSGLSRAEYRRIQHRWLERIVPEGISVRELGELIYPTRYIRGSDVLDIFGQ